MQISYNSLRVPLLIPAFGITYTSGNKTKSIIEITDNSGVKWLKMVQSLGVNPNDNGVDYSNNHPEYRYLENKNISDDCRFWLPICDWYDIKIDVLDAGCKFEVYHADVNAPNRINFNTDVAASGTYTFRLLRAKMEQSNVNQRVVKINCNRN